MRHRLPPAPFEAVLSASHSSIIAADRIIDGRMPALSPPMMSGAVPWHGWNTAWRSPMSADGAMPMQTDKAGGHVRREYREHVLHHNHVEIPGAFHPQCRATRRVRAGRSDIGWRLAASRHLRAERKCLEPHLHCHRRSARPAARAPCGRSRAGTKLETAARRYCALITSVSRASYR